MVFRTQGAADTGALISAGLATTTWIIDLGVLLQVFASLAAFVTGVAATAYHVEGWRARRRSRLDKDKSK